jgi:hypothetical protein
MTTTEKILARTVAGPNGCILWTGSISPNGYARINHKGTNQGAHRVIMEEATGAIPKGMQVDHRCGVRHCVNIKHLRLATQEENGQARTAAPYSSSGYRNVYRTPSGWIVRIHAYGVRHTLGTFKTAEKADKVARAGRLRLHGMHSESDTVDMLVWD